METKFDEKKAEAVLVSNFKEAEEMLKDEDKMERFLQRLEKN